MAGKYGILESDDWNVFNIFVIAGIDPFTRAHRGRDGEVHRDRQARVQGRQAGRRHRHDEPGAGLRRDRLPPHRRHLLASRRPAPTASRTARHHAQEGADGAARAASPGSRSPRRSTIRDLSPLAVEFLEYVQQPETAHTVAFAEGTFNPVAQMGNPEVLRAASRARSWTRSSGTAWRRRWRARSSTTSCPTTTRCST